MPIVEAAGEAPVQLAGLFVSDVLKAADAKKAIADRARWRSVNAAGLQREKERMRLEEKRRTAAGTAE